MKNTKEIMSGILVMSALTFTGVTVIEAPIESWTCFDYSTHFMAENPEWGIVTMSDNQWFRGISHMVNCRNVTANTMEIHDGLYGIDYTLEDWQNQGYYHFWEKTNRPVRNYIVMQDNRDVILEKQKIITKTVSPDTALN